MNRLKLCMSVLVLAAVGVPTTAIAQDDECTYRVCALRIRVHTFSSELVQGETEERVAGLGFFPGEMPLFAERSAAAGLHYESYRSARNTADWMAVGALAALGTAIVALVAEGGELVIAGSAVAFLGLTFGASIKGAQASDHLSLAIWSYNATLPHEP